MDYNQIPSDDVIEKTVAALKENGINAVVVNSGDEAKAKALELIPVGAPVMTMTSVTLDSLGLAEEFNNSGKYNSSRVKLNDPNTPVAEKQALGSATEWAIGSVHAVTQDGKVIIASNTGSQLGGYVYGSQHVVWVVGAQKIAADLDAGMKRVYDHVLPLESDRARKAYGVAGSNVSKVLIINKEVAPDRITMILIKEPIGF